LLAAVQLCRCSAFVTSFCHLCSVCLSFCFNPVPLCLILNFTFSVFCLCTYMTHFFR
jgi:hypothetical protein